ncbi:retrovirus-related pol polyprotein from transposon TNT 1-94 [Tanacetum coccineum]
MAKASTTQAWLWHRRLSRFNFDTINLLSKKDIVNGLPKLKFVKDHLCLSCELGKAKRHNFKTNVPSSKGRPRTRMTMALDHENSGPTPQLQETSVHNSIELRIQDHINEPPSSTLVLKVVHSTNTSDLSLQELGLLFSPMYDKYFNRANQGGTYQFDRLEGWELVDKPFRKTVIGLKWLWKNKKDEDNTFIHNKAWLLAKGYRQEEGIKFKESFSPVA